MSEIVQFVPERVLSASGNLRAGSAYTAEFYLSGTTTPLVVYQDEGLTVPHPSPLLADAGGFFPAVFSDGLNLIKAVLKTNTGATYATVDPCFKSALDVSAAIGISFAPTGQILATNVQTAIEQVQANSQAALGTGQGILTRDALGNINPRAIAGTTDQIAVTNGNGDTANPTIAAVVPTQPEAQAGVNATKLMTPLATRQALNATGAAPIYACRAWVNFNGTGVPAIRGAGNVSSITDNGVGDYTINFITPMPDVNYSLSAQVDGAHGQGQATENARIISTDPGAFRVLCTWANLSTGGVFDPVICTVAIFR